MRYYATAAFALESIAARELRGLGLNKVAVEENRVFFEGDEASCAKACIGLRSADRIYLHIKSFEAKSFDALFDAVYAIPWGDLISMHGQILVGARCVKSVLMSQPDTQSIVKKAIIRAMQRKYKREVFPEDGEAYSIEVSVLKDMVTVGMDACGESLHKRGYRTKNAPAPLKESLAAALLLLSEYKGDKFFIDPFCGSGTLPIEAAMIAHKIAPGINRRFAAEDWSFAEKTIWEQARQEAQEAIDPKSAGQIIGSDLDPKMIELSKFHAAQAGVDKYIRFKIQDAREINLNQYGGMLVTNPPYGERLGSKKEAEELYAALRYSLLVLLSQGWNVNVLTGHEQFERFFGKRADKIRRLYNGDLPCKYYQYYKR